MAIIKKRKARKGPSPDDRKKTRTINSLCKLIDQHGYTVRREKLKRGHGWRVLSGGCTAHDQQLLFVDSRLAKDEQISFLLTRMIGLGIQPSEEELGELPENIQQQLKELEKEGDQTGADQTEADQTGADQTGGDPYPADA